MKMISSTNNITNYCDSEMLELQANFDFLYCMDFDNPTCASTRLRDETITTVLRTFSKLFNLHL